MKKYKIEKSNPQPFKLTDDQNFAKQTHEEKRRVMFDSKEAFYEYTRGL